MNLYKDTKFPSAKCRRLSARGHFVNCVMLSTSETFELELNGVRMKVNELDIPQFTAFRVVFSSNRPPIVVARSKDADATVFWTSIPEGRQREAEGVGKLIEQYFQKKEK